MQLDGHLFGPDVLPSYANAAKWMYSLVIGQSDHESTDVWVSLLKECMNRWKNPSPPVLPASPSPVLPLLPKPPWERPTTGWRKSCNRLTKGRKQRRSACSDAFCLVLLFNFIVNCFDCILFSLRVVFIKLSGLQWLIVLLTALHYNSVKETATGCFYPKLEYTHRTLSLKAILFLHFTK